VGVLIGYAAWEAVLIIAMVTLPGGQHLAWAVLAGSGLIAILIGVARNRPATKVPWLLLAINTAVLLVSSVTMELARRNVAQQAALAPVKSIPGISLGDERSFPWLGITILLGIGFLAGQWLAWAELHARGFFLDTNTNSSFVFLLTRAHAVHLVGGMIALLWAGSASLLHRPVESRRIAVDITAWYWHFMAVLWIYVFALLGLAR